jgi:DNA-binding NarL/FixJ family response regulator
VFRLGLVSLLEKAYRGWEVVESDTLDQHRHRLQARSIDLLILDGRLLGAELPPSAPGRLPVNLARNVIAVTEPGDTVGAWGCLAAGAHATISRSESTDRMLQTINSVVMRHAPPIVANPPAAHSETSELLNLTSRQMDVLRLLAKGQSNKVIARDLGLSVSTVKVHLNTVFRALGATNRVEAVVRARPLHAHMMPQSH